MFKTIILFICTIYVGMISQKVYGFDNQGSTLVVGTNAEFAPFTFIENGQIIGFDIDIAQEVSKRLGKTMVLKDMPFDALIPELAFGHVHFVAAGMSYTQERAKRVLFTEPYLCEDPLIVVGSEYFGDRVTIENLCGKTVIVNEGYTADLLLSDKKGINLIRLANPADGFLAIKANRADAFVTAQTTIFAFAQRHNMGQYRCSILDGTAETCALAISKKYPELHKEVQRVLDEMIQDGTITQLKKKWNLL